jgi:2-succinyl-5-enolpyruvyl-6-hydroxy-3-cyclohexene-1-carboxylate synthase
MPAPILCCSLPVTIGTSKRLYHAQRHVGRRFRSNEMVRKNRKFIAAEAREQIAAAHRAEQPLRHDDQYFVADSMAVHIIDLLEAV